MTPVIDPPLPYRPNTAASTFAVEAVYHEPDRDAWQELVLGAPNFPEGINYAAWAHVVRPSPREAFADPLDLADLFDDE